MNEQAPRPMLMPVLARLRWPMIGLCFLAAFLHWLRAEPLPTDLDEITHYLLLAREKHDTAQELLKAGQTRGAAITSSLSTLRDQIAVARATVDEQTQAAGKAAALPASEQAAAVSGLQTAEANAIALMHDEYVLKGELASNRRKVEALSADVERTTALVAALDKARVAAVAAKPAKADEGATAPGHGELPTATGAPLEAPAADGPRPPSKVEAEPTKLRPLTPAEIAHRLVCPFCRRQAAGN